jgi:hypothetical protein
MLLLYSLTSYQRDPKSKKSFPWYLLRFTSSNGLPAVVFQASAEEQCLATLNIVVIAQWGSTEMICLDWCSTDDLCSPFIQRTSCRAKTVDHRLDTEITEQHEWIKRWKDVGDLYPNSDMRELKERLLLQDLGQRGESVGKHMYNSDGSLPVACKFVPTMSAFPHFLGSIHHS